MHNSILGGTSAGRAPNQKDWIALQKRLDREVFKFANYETQLKNLEFKVKGLKNENVILRDKVKKIEEKKESENVQKIGLVSNTAQEPKWDNKTSAPRLESK